MARQELQHFAAQVYLKAFIDPALKAKSKHHVWTYSPGVDPDLHNRLLSLPLDRRGVCRKVWSLAVELACVHDRPKCPTTFFFTVFTPS